MQSSKPTRYYSSRQERAIAKKLGAKTQSNSGATMFQKGDCADEIVLMEAKTSTSPKKSFSIKKEWMDKLREEMFAMNKQYSVLIFGFEPSKPEYVVMPIDDYKNIMEVYKNTLK